MKQFHHEKFGGFRFGEDILDAFFSGILNTHKIHEDLWIMVRFLLTSSHGQAAVGRFFFSVNREALHQM